MTAQVQRRLWGSQSWLQPPFRRLILGFAALVVFTAALLAQSPLRDAVTSLQRGDFPAAEKLARAELQAHPDDPMSLSLLGVALDGQSRFQEADPIHRRAAAAAP